MNDLKTKFEDIFLSGEITIPADKSMSHRVLIFGFLLKDKIKIKNLSLCADCLNTLKIFEQLGVKYEFVSKNDLVFDSSNINIDKNKEYIFDCGNSGTSARLLTGLFCSIEGLNCKIIGDESLSNRPMKRIIVPLEQMGAKIESNDFKLPLKIEGKKLKPIIYHSPIASAQVKSAIMLAALNCDNYTKIYEPELSRNHSELMLEYLGADIRYGKEGKENFVEIKKSKLIKKDIEVVGDISSASFFMVAGAIVPNCDITIKNVGLNPTRNGIIDIFKQAKINFEILNKRIVSNEIVGDINVKYTSNIAPFTISGSIIPRLIDEIPILAVLASFANGKSVVKDASDLRNKESDRIKSIVEGLTNLGIEIKEKPDGFIIMGKPDNQLKSAILETHFDHRLAMSYYIMSLKNKNEMTIKDFDCINTSFPEFLDKIEQLKKT